MKQQDSSLILTVYEKHTHSAIWTLHHHKHQRFPTKMLRMHKQSSGSSALLPCISMCYLDDIITVLQPWKKKNLLLTYWTRPNFSIERRSFPIAEGCQKKLKNGPCRLLEFPPDSSNNDFLRSSSDSFSSSSTTLLSPPNKICFRKLTAV